MIYPLTVVWNLSWMSAWLNFEKEKCIYIQYSAVKAVGSYAYRDIISLIPLKSFWLEFSSLMNFLHRC